MGALGTLSAFGRMWQIRQSGFLSAGWCPVPLDVKENDQAGTNAWLIWTARRRSSDNSKSDAARSWFFELSSVLVRFQKHCGVKAGPDCKVLNLGAAKPDFTMK
jgi:hypothetical protein